MEAPRIWIALRAVIKCEKRDILVTSSRTKSRDLSCTPVWRRRYDSGKWEYFHERSQKERGGKKDFSTTLEMTKRRAACSTWSLKAETDLHLSPSSGRGTPEGHVQANWIFRSEATRKSSETPFRAQRDRGWPRERKATSQPPPLRGTSFQRKEGKQRSGIAPFILYGASVFLCAALPPWTHQPEVWKQGWVASDLWLVARD